MSAAVPLMLCLMSGCGSTSQGFTLPWTKNEPKVDRPKDSITLSGGRGYEREPVDPKLREELDAAQRLMQEKKYAEAEKLYHKLVLPGLPVEWYDKLNPFEAGRSYSDTNDADGQKKKRFPRVVYEEALFGEAECQRLRKNYRDSVDTYTRLLNEFPHSRFTERTCQGLFEIADYWLEPTRRQMDEYQEQLKGKRWFVMPASYVHITKDMPLLDSEGNAVIVLNTIRVHDINGEMGKRALLYLGTIHFFRKEYKDADFYFSQIYKDYPNSPDAAKAIKQSIICKQLMTGGTSYDLRGVEKSKELLMQAQGMYKEFSDDGDWVKKQLVSMNIQQADRDFKIAEFYQRTGHPGSAYFYYELVCRRYPNSIFAEKAQQRKKLLEAKAKREHRDVPGMTPSQDSSGPPMKQTDMPRPQAFPAAPGPATGNGQQPRLLPGLAPPTSNGGNPQGP